MAVHGSAVRTGRRAVAEQSELPVVISGVCTTRLGVLAGLQRAGRGVGVAWLDAYADFHTKASSTFGYLGGMPLPLAAGVGTLTASAALGLRPVSESRILLVDARATDPGEQELLDRSAVRRTRVPDLDGLALRGGDLYCTSTSTCATGGSTRVALPRAQRARSGRDARRGATGRCH